MSNSILTNWTIYYTNDTGGDKEIRWTGLAGGTNTVLELYDALENLYDNSAQMDEGVAIKLQTPTLFTIGRNETNDLEPYFISPESIKHLTGGGLNTAGWARSPFPADGTGTIGILRVPITSAGSTIVESDVGSSISHASGDAGNFMGIEVTGGTIDYLWVRPSSNALADDFNTVSGTLTCNGHTATQNGAATTGENRWTNLFTIGTIVSGSLLYAAQDQSVIDNTVTFVNDTTAAWWGTGQIDALFKTFSQSSLVDNGYLTIYARSSTNLYDNFITDASGGGRIAIPLSTQDDGNNTTEVTTLVGFSATFGAGTTADVDANSTSEDYSVLLNGGGGSLQNLYQYLQYIQRRGSVTSLNGIEGQQYTGIDNRVEMTGVTGTVLPGVEVTGNISGATGYVAHVNTTPIVGNDYAMLHNSQGTFVVGEDLDFGGNALTQLTSVEPITPVKASPFGSFAGGTFFLARGVVITNIVGSSYTTIDDTGSPKQPPVTISFTLTNIQSGSEVRIYSNEVASTSKDTELYGVETSGTSATFNYTESGGTITYTRSFGDNTDGKVFTLTTGSAITVVIFDLDFKEVRLSLTLGAVDQSIPIQQITERNYLPGSIP